MKNVTDETMAIRATLESYFKGLYHGDVAALNSLYHPSALLFGKVGAKPYSKTLVLHLSGIAHRRCPRDSGDPFNGEIVTVILIDCIAVVRVLVTMHGTDYHELLSFHKIDNRWLIVNKMITDLSEKEHLYGPSE